MADAPTHGVLGRRPSHSADTAWLEQLERVIAMTVRERIELALRLGIAMKALATRSNGDE